MADANAWKELFRNNGWLDGNRVVVPDKRAGAFKFLSNLTGVGGGKVIKIDFQDGTTYYAKTKSETIGDQVEWDENFLKFYQFKEVKATRPWSDIANAVMQ